MNIMENFGGQNNNGGHNGEIAPEVVPVDRGQEIERLSIRDIEGVLDILRREEEVEDEVKKPTIH